MNGFRILYHLGVNKKWYIKQHVKCFTILLLNVLASVSFPSFITKIVDQGLEKNSYTILVTQTALMAITGLVMVVTNYYRNQSYQKFSLNIILCAKSKLVEALFSKNYVFWAKNKIGDIRHCSDEDLNQLVNFYTIILSQFFVGILTLILVSVILIEAFNLGAIVLLALTLAATLIQKYFGAKYQKEMHKVRLANGNEESYLNEILQNIQNTIMAGHSSIVNTQYEKLIENVVNSINPSYKTKNLSSTIGITCNVLELLLVVVLGARFVRNGQLSVGSLFAMTIYVQRLQSPLSSIIDAYMQSKAIKPSKEHIENILKNNDQIIEGTIPITKEVDEIQFSDFNFSYGNNSIFSSLNLTMKKNTCIGIIGNNGTGKSTLFKIVLKLCPYDSGIIVNGNYELKDITISSLYKQIAFLSQSIYLMSGTIREIVNPMNKVIQDETILDYLAAVGFPAQVLNNNLDYMVSEGNKNISGGEYQKLALVRLLIDDRPWFFLDEPTSAIDKESEKMIINLFGQMKMNKTIVVITHNTEWLKICDTVYNLNKLNADLERR